MVKSDDVLRELVELRGASGLSALRVRDLAPRTMSLRVVDDHLARKGLTDADRHVAADAVIRCCVEERLHRSDWLTIAERTFNFGGGWGKKLTDRRADVMLEMALSSKQYARLEQETFVQLAGTLVSLEHSGCSDNPQPLSMSDELVVELIMSEHNKLVGILRVLRGLQPDQAGRLIIDQLPKAQAFLERRRDEIIFAPAEGVYDSFVCRCIAYALPLAIEDPFEDGVELLHEFAYAVMFLECFEDWYRAHAWVYSAYSVADYLVSLIKYQSEGGGISSSYFRARGNSLMALAKAMTTLEANDEWDRIIDWLPTSVLTGAPGWK